jgi:hypothetical protein
LHMLICARYTVKVCVTEDGWVRGQNAVRRLASAGVRRQPGVGNTRNGATAVSQHTPAPPSAHAHTRHTSQREGNILMSFNNKPATDSIPFLSPLLAPGARALGPLMEQLATSPLRCARCSAVVVAAGRHVCCVVCVCTELELLCRSPRRHLASAVPCMLRSINHMHCPHHTTPHHTTSRRVQAGLGSRT